MILKAYVDGGFRDGVCGSGIVIQEGDEIKKYYFYSDKEKNAVYRNVFAEVAAAIFAMYYAYKKKADKLIVYYDYANIGKWISGEYAAKKPISQTLVKYYDYFSQHLDIEFVWVKGHGDNKLHNMADRLASMALNKQTNVQFKLPALKPATI